MSKAVIEAIEKQTEELKAMVMAAVSQLFEGNALVEIEDNGQPGQVFWCPQTDDVFHVSFHGPTNQVRIKELPMARRLDNDERGTDDGEEEGEEEESGAGTSSAESGAG